MEPESRIAFKKQYMNTDYLILFLGLILVKVIGSSQLTDGNGKTK